MADEPAAAPPVLTEVIPSVTGKISAIASANAPFIYFENAAFYGFLNGIGQVTLDAQRLNASAVDGTVAIDRVLVAHLRGNLAAIKSLRSALDGIMLMAEPKPEGPAN
jgi:hypothetical protein